MHHIENMKKNGFTKNKKCSLCVQQDPKWQRFYGIDVDGGNRRHAQQTGWISLLCVTFCKQEKILFLLQRITVEALRHSGHTLWFVLFSGWSAYCPVGEVGQPIVFRYNGECMPPTYWEKPEKKICKWAGKSFLRTLKRVFLLVGNFSLREQKRKLQRSLRVRFGLAGTSGSVPTP